MINRISQWAVILLALSSVNSLQAHHSISAFDLSTPLWLKGTVVRYEPVNPHVIIELEVRGENGQVREWVIEGPRRSRLAKLDVDSDFIKIGDPLEFCVFFSKNDISGTGRVHGHILVVPDGQKWQWGPYGRLESCVNPDEWDSIAHGTNPLRTN